MNISSTASAPLSAAAASSAAFEQALAAAKAARKRTIADDTAKVMSAPSVSAGDLVRSSAKARLLEMAKLLQMFKKLYAMNPKAMAQAVANMARELKQLVKDYEAADKQEMGAAGVATTALTGAAVSDGAATSAKAASGTDTAGVTAEANAAAATDPTASAATDSANTPATDPNIAKLAATVAAGGTSLYDAVMSQVGKAVGLDGQDFLKQVRSLVQEMSKTLQASRSQSLATKGADKTRKDFKEVDKAMDGLGDEMNSMGRQMDDLNPVNGLKLSTAA